MNDLLNTHLILITSYFYQFATRKLISCRQFVLPNIETTKLEQSRNPDHFRSILQQSPVTISLRPMATIFWSVSHFWLLSPINTWVFFWKNAFHMKFSVHLERLRALTNSTLSLVLVPPCHVSLRLLVYV